MRQHTMKLPQINWLSRCGAVALAVVLTGGLGATTAYAQDGGENRERGERGDRGERQGNDEDRAARFEQRRAERAKQLQESLSATDEDYAVLGPMIQKVTQLQREANTSTRGDGRQRRGGDRNDNAQNGNQTETSAEATAIREAAAALNAAIEEESTSAETLKEKITALRAAKAAHSAQVTAAQEELRSVLLARQEAVLIVRGVLD